MNLNRMPPASLSNVEELTLTTTNHEVTSENLDYSSQDTTINSVNLNQRNVTSNYNKLDNLFSDDKLVSARENYNELQSKDTYDYQKINYFFELHKLAKDECKHLFKIEPNPNGCKLFVNNELLNTINNATLNLYLQQDVEYLSATIIDLIKNQEADNLNILEYVFNEDNDFHFFISINMQSRFQDRLIIILLQIINFHIVNNNYLSHKHLDTSCNFDLLFNNNCILFLLLPQENMRSFNYVIQNFIFSTKINLDATLCDQSLIDKNYYAEFSNDLLVATAFTNTSMLIDLYFGIVVDQKIIKNILLTDIFSSSVIPANICLDLFKKADESFFQSFIPSENDLNFLLKKNSELISYITSLVDEDKLKQNVLLFCKIFQNLGAIHWKNINTEGIIDALKNKTAFSNMLLSKKFTSTEQLVINKFILNISPFTEFILIKPYEHKDLIDIILTLLTTLNSKQKYNYIIKHNNTFFVFFIMINYMSFYKTDRSIATRAHRLYEEYLNHDSIKELVNSDDFQVLFGIDGKLAWDSIENFEILFINNNLAMLINIEYLNQTIFTYGHDINTKWGDFFLFEDNNNIPISKYGLKTIFKDYFPIFYSSYISHQSKLIRNNIITLLDLGDYEKYFTSDSSKTENIDLSTKQHEANLAKKFNKLIEEKKSTESLYIFNITTKHLLEIKQACQISDATDATTARYLVCIAYIFIYYSSSKKFGTDRTSPIPLRTYASALLNKANQLDPECIIADDQDNSFTSWQNKLLGIADAFTCTHSLAEKMEFYLRNNFSQDILDKMLLV